MRIGLVADTHGYLGEDVRVALAGCVHILHAGDVGERVLGGLAEIAPVTAVRGNNDTAGEASHLPAIAFAEWVGIRVAVVHQLTAAPADGWDVLVFGHCHRQHADSVGGRLLINPGAAGRRGFHSRRSVAILRLGGGEPACEPIDLGPRSAAP